MLRMTKRVYVFIFINHTLNCAHYFVIILYHMQLIYLICKMYTFDQYIWLEITNTYCYNKTVDYFFHQLVLHILCNDFLLMHTIYRPSACLVLVTT